LLRYLQILLILYLLHAGFFLGYLQVLLSCYLLHAGFLLRYLQILLILYLLHAGFFLGYLQVLLSCYLLHAGLVASLSAGLCLLGTCFMLDMLLGLFFEPEDGRDTFLRSVS
jgi:hypothetical protein